jgi:hypothetical protein
VKITHLPTQRSTLWFSLHKNDDGMYQINWMQTIGERPSGPAALRACIVGTEPTTCPTELAARRRAEILLKRMRSVERQYA